MRIDQLLETLRSHGAKICHEDRILRAWLRAKPLDSGARRHRPEDFLPLGLRNALPGGLARAEHTKKAQATGQAAQRDEPQGAKPEEHR